MARAAGTGYATIVRYRSALLGLLAPLVVLSGCSGVSTGTGAGGDGGASSGAGDDTAAPVPSAAPADAGSTGSEPPPTSSGVTYPSSNLGWKPRRGTARGDTIPNVRLPGFRANDTTPTTIAMEDFYDPTRKTHDAIVVTAVSTWDTYSKTLLPRALASKPRVRVLSVLGEAQSPGRAATMADLTGWRGQHPGAAHMLDAAFATFGAAFDQAAVPLVMVVAAQSMEICTSAVGLPSDADLAADIERCIGP